MTEMKYFTLAEANRTLPLVRRIVADIRHQYVGWRDLVREYEVEMARHESEWGASEEAEAQRLRIEDASRVIDGYIAELAQIGCQLKGFEQGTVDFFGKMDGRDVFWCWSFDEAEIANWHEVEEGFAGRQPLPEGVDR